MRRLLALVLIATPAAAQERPEIPVTKLTIRPAAAPVPALRYKLLPELRDLTPGNAVQLYYRSFAPEWITNVRTNRALMEKIDAALDPTNGKRAADIKADAELAALRHWGMLKEIDRAARRAYADWELTPRIREDGVGLLLPDVHTMREFAKFLAVRAQVELADRDFDAAVRTIQTGLALGRHVAEAPTLIQTLVGVAIDTVMFNQIEELIRTPDSPNLYWALANLPRPMVDMRRPYEGERLFIDQLFPGYREALRKKTMDPLSLEVLARTRRELGALAELRWDGAAVTFVIVKKYGAAKAYLTDRGWDAATVAALPALQAVLLVEVAEYDRLYDEMVRWVGFPYPLARKELDAAEHRLKEAVVASGSPGMSLAGMMLPATMKVQFAAARADRRVAALMAVEALRLFAAETGALPDSLDAIKAVPLLPDPVTGTTILYERRGNTATLTLPPPKSDAADARNSLKYEITLVK